MQQKLISYFLSQEAGASENNIEKKPQKPRPILIYIYIYLYIYTYIYIIIKTEIGS